MNTPRIDRTREINRIVNFESDLFDVLWTKHEKIYNKGIIKQSDYFERLRKAVTEVREEIGYDYTDINDYKKGLLVDNKIIEATKEKIKNHIKLKSLFKELESIPWKSKGMEIIIWKKIFLDLVYESIEDVWEENEWNMQYMSLDNLWNLWWEELRKALSWLPKDLKILDLCDSDLWEEKQSEIKQFCKQRQINLIL